MAQIGRELEVTTETLRQWLKQAEVSPSYYTSSDAA
jgi:transposase-like protein